MKLRKITAMLLAAALAVQYTCLPGQDSLIGALSVKAEAFGDGVILSEEVTEVLGENLGSIESVDTEMSMISLFGLMSVPGDELYYNQLDADSQKAYDAFYNYYKTGPDTVNTTFNTASLGFTKTWTNVPITISGSSFSINSATIDQEIKDWNSGITLPAFLALVYDHPEMPWIEGCNYSSGYTMSPTNVKTTSADITVTISKASVQSSESVTNSGTAAQNNSAITTAADGVKSRLTAAGKTVTVSGGKYTSSASTYDTVKAIHDYICDTVTYVSGDLSPRIYQTAYSALAGSKTTVCAGYAKSFKLICDKYGIPCIVVSGKGVTNKTVPGGEAHAWNYVKIGSSWYAVDCTWDDQGSIVYDFFLAGSSTVDTNFGKNAFSASHLPSGKFSTGSDITFVYPTLSSTAYVVHTHTFGDEWVSDATSHWHECDCGEKADITVHTEVSADNAVAATCTTDGKKSDTKCSVCGTKLSTGETVPATGHTYGAWTVTKAASCTETGTKTSKCTKCDAEKTETIEKTAHTEVSADNAVAATCTTAGKKSDTKCSVCGVKLSTGAAVPATGHTEVVDKGTAATCTADGVSDGSHCSVCGAVIKAQTVLTAKGHTAGDWITDKAATTKVKGSKHKECTVCGVTVETAEIDLIPFIPVTISSAVVSDKIYDGTTKAVLKSIKFSGLKSGDTAAALNYTATCAFDDANAGSGKTVTVTVTYDSDVYEIADTVFTTKATIKKANPDVTAPAQISCKYKDGLKLADIESKLSDGWKWSDKTAALAYTDSGKSYDAVYVPADTANYNTLSSKVKVTFSSCEHNKTTKKTTAPTCTKDGKTETVCDICNETVDVTTTPATGHTEVIDAAVESTCTVKGKTEGSHCSVCSAVITAQKTLALKPHTPGEWIIDKEATPLTTGSKHAVCEVCGKTVKTETIDKIAESEIFNSADEKAPESVVTAPDAKPADSVTSVTITPESGLKHKDGTAVDNSEVKAVAKEVTDGSKVSATKNALGIGATSNAHINILDLALTESGTDISDNYKGLVKVTFPVPSGHTDKKFNLYSLTETGSGMKAQSVAYVISDNTITCYLEKFGTYALVGYGDPKPSTPSAPSAPSGSGGSTGSWLPNTAPSNTNNNNNTQTNTPTAQKPETKPALAATGRTNSTVMLEWQKKSDVDGYYVEALIDGEWERLAVIKGSANTSFECERLSPGTTYKLRVRSYTVKNGKRYVKKSGEEITVTTKPVKTPSFKAASSTKNSVKLSWKKDKNADGYQLQMYKNGKWTTVKTYAKNTIVGRNITGLKSKTTYNFRIRSYVNTEDGKVYGNYTTIKAKTK